MSVRLLACFALVASMLVTGAVSAQSLKSGEFSVQRFSPAVGPRNFITVQGARTDGKMAFSLGLFGNYGDRPFVITTCVSESDCAAGSATRLREIRVVETLVTGELLASLTVIPQLQFGLHLPYTFTHGAGLSTDPNDPSSLGQQSRAGLKGSGLGDPMAEAKVRDDAAVSFEVGPLEIVQQALAATDHLEQPSTAVMVLGVGTEVVGQVIDVLGENCHLNASRTRVAVVRAVRADDFGLTFRTEH